MHTAFQPAQFLINWVISRIIQNAGCICAPKKGSSGKNLILTHFFSMAKLIYNVTCMVEHSVQNEWLINCKFAAPDKSR